jgi:lipoic acid synthetase
MRLAHAAAQMQLKHVVVTSVDRDDVPDKGAGHYAATIRAIKSKLPEASVEVLTPDFLGVEEEALRTVIAARPEVFNHNIETVRRLHRQMRGGKADYDKALWLLQRAKELADYNVLTKSGVIVGLGETNDEVVETLRDLRAHGVDVVTIGQYLQPSPKHATIDRWVHPKRSASAPSSQARSCARAIGPTSSDTPPRPAAARLRTSGFRCR